ncbi:hypothetical protein C8R46DRAFT_1223053 [Mycena filopes]|nr:hypothetical protein C8R46DRAFT_1223053 [Mycena filopes]
MYVWAAFLLDALTRSFRRRVPVALRDWTIHRWPFLLPSACPIFNRPTKPLEKTASACSPRRSVPTVRPSARFSDPNYAEVTLPNKRKTSPIEQPTAPGKTACSSAKRVGDDDSDTQASAAGDTDVDDEPDAMARRRGIPVYQSYGGCRPTVKPWHEDSTADVNTIFRRVMGHKHLKTGVLEDGAICLICTHDGHSPAGCFMTGNVTSLRLHITR